MTLTSLQPGCFFPPSDRHDSRDDASYTSATVAMCELLQNESVSLMLAEGGNEKNSDENPLNEEVMEIY